ncbi:hypothetical protein BAQ53_24505 [Bacillus sp. B25(2016b)]|uniref:hypothetical protein n=1 Tax=Bacillus sp. B25(2016b) TaxID=1868655 RepID=UPI0008040F4B|nr:hypothetical protein [Bacillus sp. B25(2016b)]ANP83890.1 hypothetical protein BAQ53_24505 [Bacillus sp. B25(2016b)]
MARSTESMQRAIYSLGDTVRYIEPDEAITIRDQGYIKGYTLYCENHLKSGCNAEVKVVNRGPNDRFFNLMPKAEGREGHSCSYNLKTIPVRERFRNVPKDKKLVVDIDERDMFSSKQTTAIKSGEKKKSARNQVLAVPEKIITRKVSGVRNEYIRTIGELIELLHSKDDLIIRNVLKQLYVTNKLYKRESYQSLWEKRPNHTFIVEGFLDKNDLEKLEQKGYGFAYPFYKNKPDQIRIMLIYNGNGKKRFQMTLKSLLEWIDKKTEGNRKLALIKGNIVDYYEDKRIILLNVRDIDIKYKVKEYSAEQVSQSKETKNLPLQKDKVGNEKVINYPEWTEENKKQPAYQEKQSEVTPKIIEEMLHLKSKDLSKEVSVPIETEKIDVLTTDFLLQFIEFEHLQKMKNTSVRKIPLTKWFDTDSESKYAMIPLEKLKGVDNSKRRDGSWLEQLYSLNRIRQNLESVQKYGIEEFKEFIKTESDIGFDYYQDLDSYYVSMGGTHRSVIAKVLNLDYIMAEITVYKLNGALEKEKERFKEHLGQLINIIKELNLVPKYDADKKRINLYASNNVFIASIERVQPPTLYQEGKYNFGYWISRFKSIKNEGDKLNKKPLLLRKWILYYKKKSNGFLRSEEEYYYKLLENYTLKTAIK